MWPFKKKIKGDKAEYKRGAGVSENKIQLHGNTAHDRYPEVFSKMRDLLSNRKSGLKLLSFGCSTGEEAYTLATKYFGSVKNLKIIGVDVSQAAILSAKKSNILSNIIEYFESSDSVILKNGPYDAIFAMSVLCVWPETKMLEEITQHMTFSSFDRHLSNLDQYLSVGGYFVIYNASFCFGNATISKRYRPIHIENYRDSGFVKKFGPNNKSLGADFIYEFSIFEKISEASSK